MSVFQFFGPICNDKKHLCDVFTWENETIHEECQQWGTSLLSITLRVSFLETRILYASHEKCEGGI